MKPIRRNLVALLSMGAGLALGLALWAQVSRARAEERRGLWLAYLRGPLALYLEGSGQGDEALQAPPDRYRNVRLGDAVDELRQAWTQAAAMRPDLEGDAFFDALDQAYPWLGSAAQLAEDWPKVQLQRPDQIGASRQVAAAIRGNLCRLLGQQWALAQKELSWTPLEQAESLSALRALSEPLPEKKDKKRSRRKRRKR